MGLMLPHAQTMFSLIPQRPPRFPLPITLCDKAAKACHGYDPPVGVVGTRLNRSDPRP